MPKSLPAVVDQPSINGNLAQSIPIGTRKGDHCHQLVQSQGSAKMHSMS